MGKFTAKVRQMSEVSEKLQKALKDLDGMRVRVGILGDSSRTKGAKKPRGGGETNAEVGAKHEFGFTTPGGEKVPSRSFLRMPLTRMKIGISAKGFDEEMLAFLRSFNVERMYKALGIFSEKVIDEAFQTRGYGAWPANSAWTVLAKGSDSPLIDTGALRRSISSEVVKK